ncbi:hypothetical protein [Vagococcus martis]|nr:hypothetical protein [Vagococcus martis]
MYKSSKELKQQARESLRGRWKEAVAIHYSNNFDASGNRNHDIYWVDGDG